MVPCKMIIAMNEKGQVGFEGPDDIAQCFLLLEAGHEITMRRFMPPQPASPIIQPTGIILDPRLG